MILMLKIVNHSLISCTLKKEKKKYSINKVRMFAIPI